MTMALHIASDYGSVEHVEGSKQRCGAVALVFSVPGLADLPAIFADAHTDGHAGCPEADAGTRTIIPITIATAFDVSLARRII
jgi:hypothetical protein